MWQSLLEAPLLEASLLEAALLEAALLEAALVEAAASLGLSGTASCRNWLRLSIPGVCEINAHRNPMNL